MTEKTNQLWKRSSNAGMDSGAGSAKHDNRQPRRKQAVKSIIMLLYMDGFADAFNSCC